MRGKILAVVALILFGSAPFALAKNKTPKNVDGTSITQSATVPTDAAGTPTVETPAAFTLSQAIDLARNKSFQSRVEYEHVIQAKGLVKASYLHLLPQITLGTFAVNTSIVPFTGGFSVALEAICDMAPFLLPTRWFEASAAKGQEKAEEDTFKLMRLDMGVQIEGLFYVYDRDKKSAAFNVDLLKQAVAVRNEIKIREDLGQMAPGSTANMDAIVNQIQQNITTFNQVLAEDLSAVSAALGFMSPKTVTEATLDQEGAPVESALPLNYDDINTAALNQPLELDQMDELIKSAKDMKHASYFAWLDPYADPSLGLGFALPSEIAVQKSKINELLIDRDQLKSTISQKVFNAVTDYTAGLQSYKETVEGLAIQQKRLNTEKNYLTTGSKVDLFGMVGIFQDYMTAEVNLESARANFRVARSRIDRLLLQGFYAKF